MWPWWFEALLKFWFNRVVSEVALMVWSICWSFDSIEWFDVVEHLLLKLWFNRDFWSIYFWWIWRICWSFDCCNCVVETKAYGLFLALTFRDRFIRKRFCCTLWTQIPGPVVEKKERFALWKSSNIFFQFLYLQIICRFSEKVRETLEMMAYVWTFVGRFGIDILGLPLYK
jgi:hypothetical protein